MILETSQITRNSADSLDAAGVLLRDLIDYAGLFPPASLAMMPAVANYDAYLQSEWNWILGRFIVPVARLAEFEKALAVLPSREMGSGSSIWRLSALLGPNVAADVTRIQEFNNRVASSTFGGKAVIESVEVKVESAEQIRLFSGIIPPGLVAYFEIPVPTPSSGCSDCIAALASCGRRAKIRMGGETADKFPLPASAIDFIRLCAAASVPFKATAGLHHPLRSIHRLTDEPNRPSAMMHGFLNVFLAAAFLRAGMETEVALQLLEERSAQAVRFNLQGVIWREHSLSRDEIATARREFAISFGSCSFTEPIDDLRSLHLL